MSFDCHTIDIYISSLIFIRPCGVHLHFQHICCVGYLIYQHKVNPIGQPTYAPGDLSRPPWCQQLLIAARAFLERTVMPLGFFKDCVVHLFRRSPFLLASELC